MDYLVVAPPLLAKGISVGKQETPDENDSLSTHNTTIDERPDNEIIYSNSHFKFEVLETTVWLDVDEPPTNRLPKS